MVESATRENDLGEMLAPEDVQVVPEVKLVLPGCHGASIGKLAVYPEGCIWGCALRRADTWVRPYRTLQGHF